MVAGEGFRVYPRSGHVSIFLFGDVVGANFLTDVTAEDAAGVADGGGDGCGDAVAVFDGVV